MYLKVKAVLLLAGLWLAPCALAQQAPAISFHTNFEGASLGKIETLGGARFRCHIVGQHDERGRNRQANWYFFRMEGVKQRNVTLLLTNFVGEYNNKPGACAMNADTIPVFSHDGEEWEHFSAMEWDDKNKEATLKLRSDHGTIWIAHVPPYTPSRLQKLLGDVKRHPHAKMEVIGKSVQGRDLHLVTVSNPSVADSRKKTVWLIARQHAWETGTSFVMEGALRFITADDKRATVLREQVIFKFVPMMDPDGCVNGQVRFNAHGYDVNRHWDVVNPRDKKFLERMPEIFSVKKAIFDWLDAGHSIDLMLNMHNTESAEYLQTQVNDMQVKKRLARFSDLLVNGTTFAPSRPMGVSGEPGNTTNALWEERRVPVLLMEQRIGFNPKLKRRPTIEDRLDFGGQLIRAMAETVIAPATGR